MIWSSRTSSSDRRRGFARFLGPGPSWRILPWRQLATSTRLNSNGNGNRSPDKEYNSVETFRIVYSHVARRCAGSPPRATRDQSSRPATHPPVGSAIPGLEAQRPGGLVLAAGALQLFWDRHCYEMGALSSAKTGRIDSPKGNPHPSGLIELAVIRAVLRLLGLPPNRRLCSCSRWCRLTGRMDWEVNHPP
jgi:hypothetical protein